MPKIRYKKAEKGYIVKLQILGQTNENRKGVVNKRYAKFRTDKAKVLDIFHYKTGKNKKKIGGWLKSDFIYTRGKIVKSEFDPDLNDDLCTYGIHYFKSLEPAVYFFNNNYGERKIWHANGLLSEHYFTTSYGISGEYKKYHDNGHLATLSYYKKGVPIERKNWDRYGKLIK